MEVLKMEENCDTSPITTVSLKIFLIFSLISLRFCAAEEELINLADTPCGEVSAARNGVRRDWRILGGKIAGVEEFPFLASIQNLEGRHFCSGFIVKRDIILTAAHCFVDTLFGSDDYKHYQVLVGHNNWADQSNKSNLFTISSIKIHPEYSYLKPDVENDIAILKIDRPVRWTSRVQPVCLSASDEKPHEFGTVAGWGIRSQQEPMKVWLQDTNLYQVSLPLWSNYKCQHEYRKHRVNWNTKPSHICAGFQDRQQDTCQGDSGSPLLVTGETGRRIAYGIVSVGEGCANKLPGIYTRVSWFTQWIQENT